MARTSKQNVESTFKHFCNAFGFRPAESYNDVGGLELDCNNTYGGYVINEIHNEGGGVNQPFGSSRMKAGPFYDAMWLAIRAQEHAGK